MDKIDLWKISMLKHWTGLIDFFPVECGESKNKFLKIETSTWSFSSFSFTTKKTEKKKKKEWKKYFVFVVNLGCQIFFWFRELWDWKIKVSIFFFVKLE